MPRPVQYRFKLTPGTQWGKLTIRQFVSSEDPKVRRVQTPPSYVARATHLWECFCECGGLCYYPESTLRYGKIKACGCMFIAHLPDLEFRHHMPRTALLQIRDTMKVHRGRYVRAQLENNSEAKKLAYEALIILYNHKAEIEQNSKIGKYSETIPVLQVGDPLPPAPSFWDTVKTIQPIRKGQ